MAPRKKAHTRRALKRPRVARLRPGAGQGRKGLWVGDQAGGDVPCWQERKAAGIDCRSRRKEGMGWEVEPERILAVPQPLHQGVTAARVVTDRRGIRVREIPFCNPCDGAG